MTAVASFDVFDTLLTRRVSPPDAVFLFVGQRIAARGTLPMSAEAFARARGEAEHRSRRLMGGGEPTLARVYDELAWMLELPSELTAEAMREELRVEEEVIVPVPGAVDRVADERRKGRRVAFASDMYLPGEFVACLLRRHGLMQDGDLCLVSCEEGVGKRTGLFVRLAERCGIRPAQIHHTGNHLHIDVTPARALRMSATFYGDANSNRYEEILESHRWATGGATAVLAGASRLARLRVPAENDHLRTVRDVAASVAAPLLTSYVMWVLRRAAAAGIRRLYFVSRDGQILLTIASQLAPRIAPDCELRYLYGSRHAWHLPGLMEINENEQAWMFEPSEFVSVRSQLDRVGLDVAPHAQSLAASGFRAEGFDRKLTRDEQENLRHWVLSEPVRRAILAEAVRRRGIVLDYLRQEGVFDPQPWGVVDVGWRGRLLRSLAGLAAAGGGRPPVGFYLGLTESRRSDDLTRVAYLADRAVGHGLVEEIRLLAIPVEVFCTADHGTVMGYEPAGDKIRPVLRESVNAVAERWGLPILQAAVKAFAEEIRNAPNGPSLQDDVRRSLVDVLQAFWHQPAPAEGEAWGRFRFEADQTGENCRPLAFPYGFGHVPRAALGGEMPKPYMPFWVPGALASTSQWVRTALGAALRARSWAGAGLRRMWPGRVR